MSKEDEGGSRNTLELRYEGIGRILGALLLVVFAGAGGSFVQNKIDPPREDPFTGSEGHILDGRISRLEERFGGHVSWASDKRESLFHDYRDLEARLQILESKVERLEDRVDRLVD